MSKIRVKTWEKLPLTDTPPETPAVDWSNRQQAGLAPLRWLEKLTLLFEKPLNKLVGLAQLNPFYHTGTIAFFLLLVVIGTGAYLLFPYQYGFDVSYESVVNMERFFVSRVARAVHRYASAGLMFFTLLHALRMMVMDRFRGARWLAWVGGWVGVAMIWLAGLTGYWLIADQRAQLINQAFVNHLKTFPTLASAYYFTFLEPSGAQENSWLLMLFLMAIHLGLTVCVGIAFWYHVARLKRPKFLPPAHWMVIMGVLSVLIGLIFPADTLPQIDFTTVPEAIPMDLVFLFYLPLTLTESPFFLWLGVSSTIGLFALVTALPWLYPAKPTPRIELIEERCVGCEKCALDCPYQAIEMIPRDDDTPFTTVAKLDVNLCVGCGICIGSCDTMSLGFPGHPPENLWHEVSSTLATARAEEKSVNLVFACERHIRHNQPTLDAQTKLIPITCAGMLHPRLVTHCFSAGAADVQIIGCPPDDCANREGNLFMEERLARKRSPRLKRAFVDAPISTHWLAPDQLIDVFAHVREPDQPLGSTFIEPDPSASKFKQIFPFAPRAIAIASLFMTLGLLIQVALVYLPYSPLPNTEGIIQVAVDDAQTVQVMIDDQIQLEQIGPVFEQLPVSTGPHTIRVTLGDETLFDQTVEVGYRQVVDVGVRDSGLEHDTNP